MDSTQVDLNPSNPVTSRTAKNSSPSMRVTGSDDGLPAAAAPGFAMPAPGRLGATRATGSAAASETAAKVATVARRRPAGNMGGLRPPPKLRPLTPRAQPAGH